MSEWAVDQWESTRTEMATRAKKTCPNVVQVATKSAFAGGTWTIATILRASSHSRAPYRWFSIVAQIKHAADDDVSMTELWKIFFFSPQSSP